MFTHKISQFKLQVQIKQRFVSRTKVCYFRFQDQRDSMSGYSINISEDLAIMIYSLRSRDSAWSLHPIGENSKRVRERIACCEGQTGNSKHSDRRSRRTLFPMSVLPNDLCSLSWRRSKLSPRFLFNSLVMRGRMNKKRSECSKTSIRIHQMHSLCNGHLAAHICTLKIMKHPLKVYWQ